MRKQSCFFKMIYCLSNDFLNEIMVSIISFKFSLGQYDVQLIEYGQYYR